MARARKAATRGGDGGLQNAPGPEDRGGMRSEVDLINGLPPRQPRGEGRRELPVLGRRRREARMRALATKSEQPPPGTDGR